MDPRSYADSCVPHDINICEQLERNIRIAQYFILGLVKTN